MCPMIEAGIEEWSLTNTSCFILHSLCVGRQSPEDTSTQPQCVGLNYSIYVYAVKYFGLNIPKSGSNLMHENLASFKVETNNLTPHDIIYTKQDLTRL